MGATESFTLRRPVHTERGIKQRIVTGAVCMVIGASCFSASATLSAHTYPTTTGIIKLYVVAVVLQIAYALVLWRNLVIERQLRAPHVTFTGHGITYSCQAGTFSVPWSSVRSVRVVSRIAGIRPPAVRIHAPGWGGPIGTWLRRSRLELALDRWPPGLEATVHQLSQGTHALGV